ERFGQRLKDCVLELTAADDDLRGHRARRNREKAQSPAAEADFPAVQRFSANGESPHKSRHSRFPDGRDSPTAANLLLHCPMTRQARQAMLEYADRDARHRAYSTADRSAPTSVLQSDQGAFDARGARLSPHNWPWSPTAHHAHSGGS